MVTDDKIVSKYSSVKSNAASRGIEFSLSLKKIKKLLNTKTCFYTGAPIDLDSEGDDKLTFDRVDNDKGYVDDNVVACSLKFNRLKRDLSIEDITLMYKALNKKGLI